MDHTTPNLPSADFDRTIAFWSALGFQPTYRSADWLILERGPAPTPVTLEFFAAPIDPTTSWHSACWRTDDLDALLATLPTKRLPSAGIPRFDPPRRIAPDLRMAALIDPDGSLIRLLGP
jgi:catechol 2,3-dioxygenase-like lactoylglutathione lyase family enzyme